MGEGGNAEWNGLNSLMPLRGELILLIINYGEARGSKIFVLVLVPVLVL